MTDNTLADLSSALERSRTTPRPARAVRRYEDYMVMSDNLKLIFTYVVVLIVVIGGGLLLYSEAQKPTELRSDQLNLAIVGFIGLALGFVFQKETATQATRAAQASSAQGADQGSTIPHQ